MNWPVTYVQLVSNFITWISSVIVQQFCNIFHIFTGRCQQRPSAQVLVANCISPNVELFYPSDDRTIWKYKLWTYFLECFLNFYLAFTPPSLNLNPFPYNDTFWRPWETSLLKTLGKGEIAHNEQFLLFPQCFLPIWIAFCHFRQIWNCRL